MNSIETQQFSRGLRRLHGNLKDKIQTIFNIEKKSWKTSENAEEPSQKKQHFDNIESKDLKHKVQYSICCICLTVYQCKKF